LKKTPPARYYGVNPQPSPRVEIEWVNDTQAIKKLVSESHRARVIVRIVRQHREQAPLESSESRLRYRKWIFPISWEEGTECQD